MPPFRDISINDMRITGIPAEIVNLLFFGFYHAYTLITSGTVFGGKVTHHNFKTQLIYRIYTGESEIWFYK